jgi:hypothetical protein
MRGARAEVLARHGDFRPGRVGQMPIAGNPTTGSSLKVAMVSSVM